MNRDFTHADSFAGLKPGLAKDRMIASVCRNAKVDALLPEALRAFEPETRDGLIVRAHELVAVRLLPAQPASSGTIFVPASSLAPAAMTQPAEPAPVPT